MKPAHLSSAFLLLFANLALAADSGDDPLMAAMTAEVERAMEELAASEGDLAPYFLAIEAHEALAVSITGEDGALHSWYPSRVLRIDVDVRIGSRSLDSSHTLRKSRDFGARFRTSGTTIPWGVDEAVYRHLIWQEIDARYQKAKEAWAKVQAEAKTLVDEEPAEDLVAVDAIEDFGLVGILDFPADDWEAAAREGSAVLASSPAILDATVRYGGNVDTRWFVSSEGTRLRHSESRFRASAQANARAENGDSIRLFRAWEAADAAGLPDIEFMLAAARTLSTEVDAVLAAPLEEPYNGPAILSDRAAGVFFHEVFGHRVEGHRLKRVSDAQTFRNRVGERILPKFLSIYDDPTLPEASGTPLRGHYRYDNQGVRAERVVLVEDGILRGFLQSRSPVEKGDKSNGHGRKQAGKDAVSRQGSLHIVAGVSTTNEKLRAQLRSRARKDGLEYGLWIDEIAGGFTFTGRTIPNAFNVNAVIAYRVFVDGRPDELVRGIDVIGTPLEAFSNIVAAGETEQVFNGNCGAESGWVPVSSIAPTILLKQMETQRKRRGQDTPPLLPAPTPDGGAS
jgi:predicted Zn-dependent protease